MFLILKNFRIGHVRKIIKFIANRGDKCATHNHAELDGFTLNTTGTLVHGKMANSVITAVTRSEGVTSYISVNGVRN